MSSHCNVFVRGLSPSLIARWNAFYALLFKGELHRCGKASMCFNHGGYPCWPELDFSCKLNKLLSGFWFGMFNTLCRQTYELVFKEAQFLSLLLQLPECLWGKVKTMKQQPWERTFSSQICIILYPPCLNLEARVYFLLPQITNISVWERLSSFRHIWDFKGGGTSAGKCFIWS